MTLDDTIKKNNHHLNPTHVHYWCDHQRGATNENKHGLIKTRMANLLGGIRRRKKKNENNHKTKLLKNSRCTWLVNAVTIRAEGAVR